jgi:hypothetical protein
VDAIGGVKNDLYIFNIILANNDYISGSKIE